MRLNSSNINHNHNHKQQILKLTSSRTTTSTNTTIIKSNNRLFTTTSLLVICCSQLISLVLGQVGQECHFPRLTPRHSLDLSKYMGTWFLHEFASSDPSFTNVTPEFKCSRVNYVGTSQDLSSGKFVAFETFTNLTSGRTETFTVPIKIPNMRNPVNAIWDAVTINGNTKMVVLGSDMDHSKWTLLYGCNIGGPTGNYRWETVAIWSRSRSISAEQRDMLKAMLVGLGLPIHTHKIHSQTGC